MNFIAWFLKSTLLLLIMFVGFSVNAQVRLWTLKDCINQALDKNVQLNQIQLISKLSKIDFQQAKENLFPNLNLSDGQTFSFGYSTDPYTYQSAKQNIAANNLSLSSSVTLFNGFQLVNTIKQYKYLYNAGIYDVDKTKNDILLSVIAGYLQVLYSNEVVKIAKAQTASTIQQVDRTQKYVNAEKLAESNLLQVKSQLASDKAAQIGAENQLQLVKVTLMQLMNMPVTPYFEIDTSGISEPSVETGLSEEVIYKISEGIMPEINSAKMKTKADSISVKIAKGTLLPKLTLAGALRTGYSSSNNLISSTTIIQQQDIGYLQSNPAEHVIGLIPVTTTMKNNYPFFNQIQDNFSQAISLNLTVPIFNNYQGKNGIKKAQINLDYAKYNEQATRDQLRKTIEQTYADLIAAINNYSSAKEALSSEERSYSDMEKKFGLGLVSATDFIIEKNNYEKAYLSLIQAKYNYIFKSKIINFYLGKSLPN